MATFEVDIGGQTLEVEADSYEAASQAARRYLDSASPAVAPDDKPGRIPQFADPRAAGPLMERSGEMGAIEGGIRDAAKQFGTGVVRGVTGLVTLPGTLENLVTSGLDKAAERVTGKGGFSEAMRGFNEATNSVPYDFQRGMADVERVTGKLPEPTTTAGEYARTAGEFAPGAVFPGTMAQRALNTVVPALASETAGQITKGTPSEPWARLLSAMAAPFAVKAGASVITPVPAVTPQRAANADLLRAEGVTDLTAGQATGNRTLQYAESALGDAPMAGGQAQRAQQNAGEQFTQAALRRTGTDAPLASDEVIAATRDRIGDEFERLSQNTNAHVNRADIAQLRQVQNDYLARTPIGEQLPWLQPGQHSLADLMQQAGTLPGDLYQSIRSHLGRVIAAGSRPENVQAAREVQNILDRIVERSMPRQLLPQWQEARRQYRNLVIIEDAIRSSGAQGVEGVISPASLNRSVANNAPRDYLTGQGDLTQLAKAGAATMRPLPQSGTAPRAAITSAPAVAGAAVGSAFGGAPEAAAAAAAGLATPGLAGRVLMSQPMQMWLRNQRLADFRRNTSATEAAAPGTAGGAAGADRAQNQTRRFLLGRGVPEELVDLAMSDQTILQRVLREMSEVAP